MRAGTRACGHSLQALIKHRQYRELAVQDWLGALLRARQRRSVGGMGGLPWAALAVFMMSLRKR